MLVIPRRSGRTVPPRRPARSSRTGHRARIFRSDDIIRSTRIRADSKTWTMFSSEKWSHFSGTWSGFAFRRASAASDGSTVSWDTLFPAQLGPARVGLSRYASRQQPTCEQREREHIPIGQFFSECRLSLLQVSHHQLLLKMHLQMPPFPAPNTVQTSNRASYFQIGTPASALDV